MHQFISFHKINISISIYQFSTEKNVNAGVLQGSILGSLLFLIYINDLTEGRSSNAKLFADDTSLFSVIHDIQTPANSLSKDLEKINNWDNKWKMNFNPDTNKQAQEVIFSLKFKASNLSSITVL